MFCCEDEDVNDDSAVGRYVDYLHGDAICRYDRNNSQAEEYGFKLMENEGSKNYTLFCFLHMSTQWAVDRDTQKHNDQHAIIKICSRSLTHAKLEKKKVKFN